MKLSRDKYLTPDEFRRLIYAARTRPHVRALRDRALLTVSGLCGLRVGEAVALRVADCHLSDQPPTITVYALKKRSADPEYEVGLPPSAARALQEYLRSLPDEQRQPWQRVFPITRQSAHRTFKYYAKLAGLSPAYSFHALRHFRGVQVYQETRDPKLCQQALRHANLASTEPYIHLVDEQERLAKIDLVDVGGDGYKGIADNGTQDEDHGDRETAEAPGGAG